MKKESKAARAMRIYAEHGISYDMASGKIYAPILDKVDSKWTCYFAITEDGEGV